jgi:hypothetical protein
MDWERTYLPEHLWLAYLVERYGIVAAVRPYDQLCDLADQKWSRTDDIFLGYISDFSDMADDARRVLLAEIDRDITPFGPDLRAVLALYPSSPAVWLAVGGGADEAGRGYSLLRRLVSALRDSHSTLASEARLLAFRRMCMKQRLRFSPDVPDERLVDAFLSYPNIDEESTRHVHQFVRMTMNMVLSIRAETTWPGHFWQSNLSILECK